MPLSEAPEVFAAQIIFGILLPFVLFAPPRWAILAWLLMGNLDATGPGQQPSEAVGWINAVKGVALPLYLWWRLRAAPTDVCRTLPARLWLLLTAYAAVAAIWSPFPLAAAKLVGNMIGVMLMIIILEKSVRQGTLDSSVLVPLVIGSLFLGALQTYFFAGRSYSFDGIDQPLRFSSFIGAQQYAGFLVAFLAVLLTHASIQPLTRFALSGVVCVALMLNGSRTWFVGASLLVAVYIVLTFRRVAALVAFAAGTVTLAALLVVNVTTIDADVLGDTSNRIVETVNAVLAGRDTLHSAGLRNLNFRFAIYDGVLSDLNAATTAELLLGHGTSSGGLVAMRVFPGMYRADSLDPNRTIHDEWLRSLYEWGLAGLGLLLGVFASLTVGLAARWRDPRWRTRAAAVLSFLPALLAAMSMENILAGAGNAVTMSFGIVIALVWAPASAQTGGDLAARR